MKKIIPILAFVSLLFIGCSTDLDNNEDAVLLEQIQGKWKLTASQGDTDPAPIAIANGYETEFNADKTFVSNEENGFNGGSYTILKEPNNNLRMVFRKNWDSKVVYKYISSITATEMQVAAVSQDPIEGEVFFGTMIFTRIP